MPARINKISTCKLKIITLDTWYQVPIKEGYRNKFADLTVDEILPHFSGIVN